LVRQDGCHNEHQEEERPSEKENGFFVRFKAEFEVVFYFIWMIEEHGKREVKKTGLQRNKKESEKRPIRTLMPERMHTYPETKRQQKKPERPHPKKPIMYHR